MSGPGSRRNAGPFLFSDCFSVPFLLSFTCRIAHVDHTPAAIRCFPPACPERKQGNRFDNSCRKRTGEVAEWLKAQVC